MTSKIYEFRKRKRWTLNKLSQLSGIPLNTIWRMEKGHGVTLRNAFTIAKLFGVTVYDLWEITPSATPDETSGRRVTSVRKLRLERHWRLDDLAKSCGVSKTTLSEAESGHTPTLENAARIAAALNASIYDIWTPSRFNRKLASSK